MGAAPSGLAGPGSYLALLGAIRRLPAAHGSHLRMGSSLLPMLGWSLQVLLGGFYGHRRSRRGLRGWMDSPRASISRYSASLRSRVVGSLTELSR